MSIQQIIALVVIVFFIFRIIMDRYDGRVKSREFLAAFIFWFLSALAVVFIRKIDVFVASVGFSGAGIDVLFYITVILVINYLFKLRLRQERMEREITKLTRALSLAKNK